MTHRAESKFQQTAHFEIGSHQSRGIRLLRLLWHQILHMLSTALSSSPPPPLFPQTSEWYNPLCFISAPTPHPHPSSESDPKVCLVERGGAGGWMMAGIAVRERWGHGSPTPKSSPGLWQNHPPSDHHYVTASLVSAPRTGEGCDWQAPGRPLYKEGGRRASQSLWCRKSSGLWM